MYMLAVRDITVVLSGFGSQLEHNKRKCTNEKACHIVAAWSVCLSVRPSGETNKNIHLRSMKPYKLQREREREGER